MDEEQLQRFIREYLQDHLSVEVKSETSCEYSTDGSTKTRFSVALKLSGEIISEDSYYE